jgi:RNA polymerase sigma-70 factor (ECF subfamily)
MTPNVIPFTKKGEHLSARSDDDLMLLSSQGVAAAFEELVRRYSRRVRAYCAKQLGDAEAGDELAQEIWMSVWGHRAEYRPEGKFVVWLFTLMRNRIRNSRRDLSRRPVAPTSEDPIATLAETPDLSPSELDRLLTIERRARVDRALAAVPDLLRDAVLLRFTNDLPYEQIAQILDTNESTARSRVFHGLRELRRRLKGES